MRPITTIIIDGKPYNCLLTVTVMRVLEDAGLSVKMYDSPAAALAEMVKLIWAGCKNYCEYKGEDFELSLMDVDMWASTDKEEFARVIAFWAELNKPASDRSGMGGVRDETEKKKS